MRGLKGKRILIGAGGTGIGAALANRLAEEGARLVVGDLNHAAAEETAARLRADGADAAAAAFDLADEETIKALVANAAQRWGGLDGLAIPGADLSKATLGADHDIEDMTAALWTRTLSVNLVGHALLMRTAIPHMIASGGGGIVSVSSASAYTGSAMMPAYAASKAGLNALVRHVATRWGENGIRCNAVAPGLVITPGAMVNFTEAQRVAAEAGIPLGRAGQPEDIAGLIAFLLSDDGAWISGQVVSANGGVYLRE